MKIKKKTVINFLVRIILTGLLCFAMLSGYRYMHKTFSDNAETVNKQVDKKLPSLERENVKLKKAKRSAYDNKLVVDFHYKKAFSSDLSSDKVLKKWIRTKNNAEDHLASVTEKLNTNQKEINTQQKKHYSKTDLHNSQSNLGIISIIILIVVLFFIWSV